MPLIWTGSKLEVTCINLQGMTGMPSPDGPVMEHPMVELDGWGLVSPIVPGEPTGGAFVRTRPITVTPVVLPTTAPGIPVRVYMCKTCGYIELYSGIVVAPETWRDG